jgi:hypothetical protein
MNYFGHAAVATRTGRSARFVLGAMLPDLVPMAGVQIPKDLLDRELTEGIRFHIETDALFHSTVTFVELNLKALAELRSLGISRGPARACAHVGVEMCLDSELSKDDAMMSSYEAALTELCRMPELLAPMEEAERLRAEQLSLHLLRTGRQAFHSSSERFALRLDRTLAPRQRLAPTESELPVISEYLSRFTDPAARCAELMRELAPLWQETPNGKART